MTGSLKQCQPGFQPALPSHATDNGSAVARDVLLRAEPPTDLHGARSGQKDRQGYFHVQPVGSIRTYFIAYRLIHCRSPERLEVSENDKCDKLTLPLVSFLLSGSWKCALYPLRT